MWCVSPCMFLHNHVQKKWLYHFMMAYVSTLFRSPRIAADLSTRACWLQGHVWCQKVMKQLNGLGLDHTILLQIDTIHMVPPKQTRLDILGWGVQERTSKHQLGSSPNKLTKESNPPKCMNLSAKPPVGMETQEHFPFHVREPHSKPKNVREPHSKPKEFLAVRCI